MEPIRVLHVLTSLNRGGIETMLMNYYRNIDKTKIQFDFLIHREGSFDYSDEILRNGGKIYSVPEYNPFSRKYRKSLDSFFSEHKEYRIVHSHLNCLSALPLKYAKKNNIENRIAHSHIIIHDFSLKKLYKRVARFFIPLYATEYLACSKEAGKWMFGNHRFEVMHNAIDVISFKYNKRIRDSIRSNIGVDNELVIGHVGRLTEQKNQRFMLDIAEKLKLSKVDYKLVLIGEGEDKRLLEDLARIKHIESNVIFIGSVDNVNEWMQAFDIFLFPSKYEGLGIVAVEAQAAGLFVICSDRVPREVKATDNCIFLRLNDVDLWYSSILNRNGALRTDNTNDIIRSGYDIYEASKKLQTYYISKHYQ